jgi:hypothetical protein
VVAEVSKGPPVTIAGCMALICLVQAAGAAAQGLPAWVIGLCLGGMAFCAGLAWKILRDDLS